MTTTESSTIRKFRVRIPQRQLDDLHRRLRRTRWSPQIEGTGWERGVPTDYLRQVAEYWADDFDWRAQEDRINEFDQFTTVIDGLKMHFLHVRSAEPDATPLLLLHGWPGSFVEFLDLVRPLTDPVSTGGRRKDAFHVVVPSLPGYAFSGPLTEPGWNDARTASALTELMARLGYERYGIQGGDVGAFLAPRMARLAPENVIGLHVNALLTFPDGDPATMKSLTKREQGRLGAMQQWQEELGAYMQLQGTRPQTLAAALHDSPAGQLAWILERFKDWTDPSRELPEDAVDLDRILTDVSLYWFTGTAGSSAQTYYERFNDPTMGQQEPSDVPMSVAVFPTDFSIRAFGEKVHNIVRWKEFDKGGHFAALETPDTLLSDLRTAFRNLS